jgi:hypothetical protein
LPSVDHLRIVAQQFADARLVFLGGLAVPVATTVHAQILQAEMIDHDLTPPV